MSLDSISIVFVQMIYVIRVSAVINKIYISIYGSPFLSTLKEMKTESVVGDSLCPQLLFQRN